MTIKTTWILMAAGLLACGGSSRPAATTAPAQPAAESEAAPADAPAATPAPAEADQTPTEWKQAGWSEAQPAQPAEQPAPVDEEGARLCREVVPHILDIFRTSLDATVAGMTPEEQARVREEMEKELNQEAVIAECMKQPLTQAQFDCAMAASTMEGLMKCEKAE